MSNTISKIKRRMTEYYPQVLKDCRDIQSIILAEYPEFDLVAKAKDQVENEAFLDDMTEGRIAQWEKLLGLSVLPTYTLDERRRIIEGKLRDPGKLNETVIQQIVSTMTNGTAEVSFADGVLTVEITPSANDGLDLYPNVDQALEVRMPAHIWLNVTRKLATWQTLLDNEDTWGDVKSHYSSWRYVKTIVPNA